MKTDVLRTSTTELGGNYHTEEMTIVSSGKAFELLSTLYSDPETAIIRELSCNAYDSHKQAGKEDVPFTVHLPCAEEPWLSVSDTGVGLSKEEIFGICSKYFGSTKETSNDFIGNLGLGMKSPFAYERSSGYFIIGIKDGMKTDVCVYYTDDGFLPKATIMSHEPTTEPNGVEVRLTIHRDDFDKFKYAALRALRPFTVLPIITGNVIAINRTTTTDVDGIPGLKAITSSGSGSIIRMGNIDYPIETSKCYDLKSHQRAILSRGRYLIEVPIGAVNFLPSREHLKYNNKTNTMLREFMDAVDAQAYTAFKTIVDAMETPWKRYIKASEICRRNYHIFEECMAKYIENAPEGFIQKSVSVDVDDIGALGYTVTPYIREGVESTRLFDVNTTDDLHYSPWGGKKVKESYDFSLTLGVDVVIIDDNPKVGSKTKIKYIMKNCINSVIKPLSEYMHNTYRLTLWVIHSKDGVDADALNAAISNFPCVLRLSQLPDKPKSVAAAKKSRSSNTKILCIDPSNDMDNMTWGYIPTSYLDTLFESKKEKLYIPLSGFEWNPHVIKNHNNLSSKRLIEIARRTNMIPSNIKVYGVRKVDMPSVMDDPTWINIEQYILDKVRKITTSELRDLILNSKIRLGFYLKRQIKELCNQETFDKRSDIYVINNIITMKDVYPGASDELVKLCKLTSRYPSFKTKLTKANEMVDSIFERYAMMLSSSSLVDVTTAQLTRYISAMDKS